MKGIIIAAGLGSRMAEFTADNPKCFLKVGKKSLLEWSYKHLSEAGCKEIYVITGHMHNKIKELGYKTIINKNYKENNILHSLFHARHLLNSEIMISYSDIYVEPQIYIELKKKNNDIVVTMDKDWEEYYKNRDGVPLSQSEKVELKNSIVTDIGKHVEIKKNKKYYEFIGLFKLSNKGCKIVKDLFDDLNFKFNKEDKFIYNTTWHKAYITDFFHYMIKSKKGTIHPHIISKCWAEFDTNKDYLRLNEVIKTQKLNSVV